jgi:hypothetical protein
VIFRALIRCISPNTEVETFASAIEAFEKISDQSFDASANTRYQYAPNDWMGFSGKDKRNRISTSRVHAYK